MSEVKSIELRLGWEAPDFELKDTEGDFWNLSKFSDYKGLLVVFTCNHCPYAKAAWPLLVDLHEMYADEVGFVAINSNDAIAYPEDSFENMKKFKDENQILFPYLYDEFQETAEDYFAQCTPDVYLFNNLDGVFQLFYHGRINDNWKNPEEVKEHSLEDAIVLMLDGKNSPQNQLPSIGCSIKYRQ